jgi:small subunit ribosomal protein S3
LAAENVALQLERRVAFRRAMKESVSRAMRMGAQGVKIQSAGRLGGSEIARTEWYREGRVPLHTLRADIDYGFATANTAYGSCGIKVWVFKGEILEHDPMAVDKRLAESLEQPAGRPREQRERPDRDRPDRVERQRRGRRGPRTAEPAAEPEGGEA